MAYTCTWFGIFLGELGKIWRNYTLHLAWLPKLDPTFSLKYTVFELWILAVLHHAHGFWSENGNNHFNVVLNIVVRQTHWNVRLINVLFTESRGPHAGVKSF